MIKLRKNNLNPEDLLDPLNYLKDLIFSDKFSSYIHQDKKLLFYQPVKIKSFTIHENFFIFFKNKNKNKRRKV